MTRDEAVKAVSRAIWSAQKEHGVVGHDVWSHGFVMQCEALGLIKLEVPAPARKFATGDIVKLGSGGPEMTVYRYRTLSDIEVEWFSGLAISRDCFPEVCLRKIDPPIKP